jgi:hypothetical protein
MLLFKLLILLAAATFLAVEVVGQAVSVVGTGPVGPGGHMDVFLKVEPLSKGAKIPDLSVKDVTEASGADTSGFQLIGAPDPVGHSSTRAFWRTSWMTNSQVLNRTPTRTLLVQFGDLSELVSVTVQKPGVPQVTVVGPGTPLNLNNSHSISFGIVTSGSLTNVKPSFSTLLEEKTGEVISVDKLSVSTVSGQTGTGIAVNDPSQVVWLTVASDFDKPGKFTGNVSLSSQQKADLGTFAITVYSTAGWRKLVGALFLVLGVAIYFGVAIWAKARNKQLLAALPAARLREQAQLLKNTVTKASNTTQVKFNNLLGPTADPYSLDSVIDSLETSQLKAKGRLPQNYFSAFSDQDPSAAYQTFLAGVAARIAVLDTIVRWGIGNVLRQWDDLLVGGQKQAGTMALQNLDTLAASGLPQDQVTLQVQNIISTLAATLLPPAAAQAGVNQAGGGGRLSYWPAELGSQEITLRLEHLSIFVWVLWAVTTVFVGLCALVLFSDAFGRTQDWIQCLLWGIGMPAVANGFGAMNANSVSSALSFSLPR